MTNAPRHLITSADLKALCACRALVIHGNIGLDGQTQDAMVRILVEKELTDGTKQESETVFTTHARCDYYGVKGERERFAGGQLRAHLFHYPSQVTALGSIFALLKLDDEVAITWGVGGHRSKTMEGRGIFGDSIQINVRRIAPRTKKVVDLVFVLDTVITDNPNNRVIVAR